MLASIYYWLAQYLSDRVREHPGPPDLPIRVPRNRVLIHQTADKKQAFPGENGSGGTIAACWERWGMGNEQEMRELISVITQDQEQPEPNLWDRVTDLEAEVELLKGRVTALENQ